MRDEQQLAATDENAWRWQQDARNPYLHNVFTILGLRDPNASDKEFVKALKGLQRDIKYDKSKLVSGYKPKNTDIAAAQKVQTDANLLAQERLLVHMRHELNPERLAPYISAFAQLEIESGDAMLPLPLSNIEPIAACFPEPRELQCDTVQPPDLSVLMPLLRPDPNEEQVLPR